MKRITVTLPELLRIVNHVLFLLAAAMIVLLIAGTIFALVRPSGADPLFRLGASGGAKNTGNAPEVQTDDIRVFSGLGRLRIPLSDSSTMVLSIAFPYSAGDIAFTEELAAKIDEFRDTANDYFYSLPAEKLVNFDEDAAKAEILSRFNAGLRLGRIEALYFSDMIIIDRIP